MVDGQTIHQLRSDLDVVYKEVIDLKALVVTLESKLKLFEGLTSEDIQTLISKARTNTSS